MAKLCTSIPPLVKWTLGMIFSSGVNTDGYVFGTLEMDFRIRLEICRKTRGD